MPPYPYSRSLIGFLLRHTCTASLSCSGTIYSKLNVSTTSASPSIIHIISVSHISAAAICALAIPFTPCILFAAGNLRFNKLKFSLEFCSPYEIIIIS